MRLFKYLVVYPLLLLGLATMAAHWWVHHPLSLPATVSDSAPLEFEIPAGSSARAAANRIVDRLMTAVQPHGCSALPELPPVAPVPTPVKTWRVVAP